MRVPIPFTGQSYKGEATFTNAQRCVNFYPRPYPQGGEGKLALFGTPGLESWVDLGTSLPIRGMIAPVGMTTPLILVLSGSQFFKVTEAGVATEVGANTIATSNGLVSMSSNGSDVIIVDGLNGYVYDISADTLTVITDVDFPGGGQVIFVDGYYFVNDPGTNQFHQSTQNNGLSWPGNFDSAGSTPGDIIAMIQDHEDAYFVKEEATEIWYNAANTSGVVLSPITGAFNEIGAVAKHSIARGNNAVFWLAKDTNGQGQVVQTISRAPQIISTPPIEFQIASYSDISDVVGFTYQQLGHEFYVLNFPTGGVTWVYDSTTGFWHERSSRFTADSGLVTDGLWRINTHALFNNDHIGGDFDNGKLYKIKTDVYDEDGEVLISIRAAQTLRQNQDSITVNSAQILMEPGIGLVTGQGSDPKASFRWSTDGGFTWSNAIDLSLGKIGEYRNRFITGPLGQGRNWVPEIQFSDPTQRVIVDAFMDAEQDID